MISIFAPFMLFIFAVALIAGIVFGLAWLTAWALPLAASIFGYKLTMTIWHGLAVNIVIGLISDSFSKKEKD